MPFEFYSDDPKPPVYPDAGDEQQAIRALFQWPGLRSLRDNYVVCAATPRKGAVMRYSCCILSLWLPPYPKHAIKQHILAHSCPEDLRRGIDSLLSRLGVNHWVRPSDQYNVFNPILGGSWWVQNHSLPHFMRGYHRSHTERVSMRSADYDQIFDSQLNGGRLTLLDIHLERSLYAIGRSDAEVHKALLQAVEG